MKKNDWELKLLAIMCAIVVVVFLIVPIVLSIVAHFMYGDAPIKEVPLWAYLFVLGR